MCKGKQLTGIRAGPRAPYRAQESRAFILDVAEGFEAVQGFYVGQ